MDQLSLICVTWMRFVECVSRVQFQFPVSKSAVRDAQGGVRDFRLPKTDKSEYAEVMKNVSIPLSETGSLPRWRRPESLLFLMAFAMPVAFATWNALLNNFVIEAAHFTGVEIGWLHTVREIPGFLAIGVIALIMVIREQVLGIIALLLLGVATAVTAFFPLLGRDFDRHDVVVDRVSLFRDGEPIASTAMAVKRARADCDRAACGGGIGGLAGGLRAFGADVEDF